MLIGIIKMFNLKEKFGDHCIYSFPPKEFDFLEYFQNLFNTSNLEQIHLLSQDYKNVADKDGVDKDFSNMDVDLHKKFYNDIKTNEKFKVLYTNIIKAIFDQFFPDEEVMIFQSFPSLRIQFFDNIVVPPHFDSDDLGKHPLRELNFIIPITRMFGTNTVFIESTPGKGDFKGIELDYGNLFFFNGNTCTHYNLKNIEGKIRMSLDFRIILLKDYARYLNNFDITYTNPRDPNRKPVKMTIGCYYQICFKNTLSRINNWFNCKSQILQSRPNFDDNEADAVYKYMKGDNFFTEFKYTAELEKVISKYIGCKYCVMVNNGTVSLVLALLALDIGVGCDVIVPNYTMIASINAIKMVGARPIIIDVDFNNFVITLDCIKKALTPNTKAIMHVSLNNHTNDIATIESYCKENGIYLIEDAAQSLGCRINGRHIGTFGIIGSFSLSTPKIISTGQGGFLITNDDHIYSKMCKIKNFGRKTGGIDDFEIFGLNFKFTDIQAIIGLEQMKKLDTRVIRMRQIFDLYFNELKELNSLPYFKIREAPNTEWIPWFIEILVDTSFGDTSFGDKSFGDENGNTLCGRNKLMKYLEFHNIQSRATYPIIHKTTMYNNLGINDIDMINSNYISDNGLFLPSHTLLTDNEIIFVCNVIKSFFKMPVLNVKKVFMTLTACNSTDITSPFYIKGQNNGIGNSLFQIASGLNYARKHNAKLFVPSLETYLKTEGLQKEDTIFRYINTDKPDDYNELQLVNSNDNREYIFKHKYYNNINFHNYFENINNIADFKKDLLELFSPSAEQIAYLISKYPVLQSTDNICSLHIRRGPDICSIYSEHHLKQIENYTFELLDYMIEKKNITNIFVLTNDRAYCNAILDGNSRYTGLTFYYSAERDYYDIWIISLIKNNIISASTLSWWGSFLNKYSDKFIIGHHKNIGTYNPEWLYI